MSWLATLASAILFFFASGEALGQEYMALKQARIEEDGKALKVTVGFREMLDGKLVARLRSGFATTVVMRVYLYEQSGDKPVAFAARTLKAVYDLWDEQFLLRLEGPAETKTVYLREQKQVVDRLTSLWRFSLVSREHLKTDATYFVAVIAEVNPMSEALLEEVRRWLRNPYSEHRPSGSSSLFGSFVSIFVNNKIRNAEKTFRLRTQPFFLRP